MSPMVSHGDDHDNDDDDDDKDDDKGVNDHDNYDKKMSPKQAGKAGLARWSAKPTKKMCTGLQDLLK